ncbi:MAG: hypothetical protein WCS01_11385, partial [bacterium]
CSIPAESVGAGLEYRIEGCSGGKEVPVQWSYRPESGSELGRDTIKVSTVGMDTPGGYYIASLHRSVAHNVLTPTGHKTDRYMLGVSEIADPQHPAYVVVNMKDLMDPPAYAKLKAGTYKLAEEGVFWPVGVPLEESIKTDPDFIWLLWLFNDVYSWNITADELYDMLLPLLGINPADAEYYWQLPKIYTTGEHKFVIRDSATTKRIQSITVTVIKVDIDSVDANFAPSVEKLAVRYTIKPTGYTASFGKLEVFKTGDAVNPVYKDETIVKTGANVLYEWDGKANQGTDNGKYVGPRDSPYTIKVSISEVADFSSSSSDTKTTKVEVESLAFNISAATTVIMNDPEHKEEVSILVKLKKKDGTGAATAVPVYVDLSFSDPGDANTAKNDSYEYVAGKFLGKKDDATAVCWEDHAKTDSDSTDGYKLVCRGKTITAAGADLGKTFVWFKPSGVGGDDFKLKAVVKHTDGSELKAVDSGVLTMWRKATFDKIYEMAGETHVSVYATEAKIQLPYFTQPFVDYEVGAAKAIPPDKSVKYIGLWNNTASHQEDWATMKAKLAAEKPSDQEVATADATSTPDQDVAPLGDFPGPGDIDHDGDGNLDTAADIDVAPGGDFPGPGDTDHNGDGNLDRVATIAAQNAARVSITDKAQAWVNRIDAAFFASLAAWKANGGIVNNSIVAIKYYHPKYSSGGGDFATDEWPYWVRVTTFIQPGWPGYPNRDPDGMWPAAGADFGGLSHGNGIFSIPTGWPEAITVKCIAHEAGHATKSFFERQDFGANKDHSDAPGLMDPTGTQLVFTDNEKKILRGIKP